MTELVTGLDLVQEQFALATGEPLSRAVMDAAATAVEPTRHAIEVRLTAEDPSRAFAPTPGRVRRWVMPAGPGVRVDTGLEAGARIPPEYDNLMAKIMAVDGDRAAAIARLRRALDETEVAGVQTTLPFHRFVARDAGVRRRRPEHGLGGRALGWPGRTADARSAQPRRRRSIAVGAGVFGPAGDPPADTAPATDRAQTGWRAAARDEALDRWPA